MKNQLAESRNEICLKVIIYLALIQTAPALAVVYGDANSDGSVNIGDAVHTLNCVFHNGPLPEQLYLGDSNCDRSTNIGDAVSSVNFVFGTGWVIQPIIGSTRVSCLRLREETYAPA